MILKFITVALSSLLLFSCNNESKEMPVMKEEKTQESGHHHHDLTAIELNNGEKWTVDKDMMAHIGNMEKDLVALGKNVEKDYAVLSKKLLANSELLTSNCTMTGKAHDELHKWLLPYIDLVGELEAAENEVKAVEFFKEVEHSFHTFNKYFK
jgi:hypothetical protein